MHFGPRRFWVRIWLLLHLTCTNIPSFPLPTLHQWRKRPSGSYLASFYYIFPKHFVDNVVFFTCYSLSLEQYIIFVAVLLLTENRVEIHADRRRWRVANSQCSTWPERIQLNEILEHVMSPELRIEPGTSKVRSSLSDRSSTMFCTNVLIFHLLLPFHIATSCFCRDCKRGGHWQLCQHCSHLVIFVTAMRLLYEAPPCGLMLKVVVYQ